MNILFFGPFNYRARDNESLMLKFNEMGHNVFFLNHTDSDDISNFLISKGISCSKLNGVFKNKFDILRQVFFLRSYIIKNKIELVFSHLDPSSFISVLTQYLVKCRFVIVRHHVDELHLTKQNKKLSYWLIYMLAKDIVVVSGRAKQFMIEQEKISAKKINIINLSYNFELFDKPFQKAVDDIRSAYPAKLLLLTASRLTNNKRTILSVQVLQRLLNFGVDAKLLILGQGELEEDLRRFILVNNLENYCSLLGYKSNIMDYLAACDILLNPSIADSSSVIIKEAGLQSKVIVACNDIGDCNDYIESGVNGYLVDKEKFVQEASCLIKKKLQDENKRAHIGASLKASILHRFDVDINIREYYKYL